MSLALSGPHPEQSQEQVLILWSCSGFYRVGETKGFGKAPRVQMLAGHL